MGRVQKWSLEQGLVQQSQKHLLSTSELSKNKAKTRVIMFIDAGGSRKIGIERRERENKREEIGMDRRERKYEGGERNGERSP